MATAAISLVDLLGIDIEIDIVDIGANPIDGEPPYRSLMSNGIGRVVGFEPNQEALNELISKKGPHEIYLPYVIGDGRRHTLHICRAPGMTSLLTPDRSVLESFRGFPEWGQVIRTETCDTLALDDVAEISGVDLLKIDIQGAELMVFKHAPRLLKDCIVVHTEVEFLPMYVDQPLFSEVEQHLRSLGFLFHKFDVLVKTAVAPLVGDTNVRDGIGQTLWADAVFVRDFMQPDGLSDAKLLKLCVILHDVYKSFDIVLRLLGEYDRRHATNFGQRYLSELG